MDFERGRLRPVVYRPWSFWGFDFLGFRVEGFGLRGLGFRGFFSLFASRRPSCFAKVLNRV